ncbi:hypothetical protein ACQZ4R_16185 [Agrobacterium vitis]
MNWQIISLEHDTGLPLLERLPHGVLPTATGERRLAICSFRRRNSG